MRPVITEKATSVGAGFALVLVLAVEAQVCPALTAAPVKAAPASPDAPTPKRPAAPPPSLRNALPDVAPPKGALASAAAGLRKGVFARTDSNGALTLRLFSGADPFCSPQFGNNWPAACQNALETVSPAREFRLGVCIPILCGALTPTGPPRDS